MYFNENILHTFLSRLEREKTKNDYKRDITKFIEFINKDFIDATFDDCKSYINLLNNKISEKNIATSTAEKLYSQLYSFFKYLEEENYIQYNHFKKIAKPVVSRNISKDKIITWQELDKIISVLKTYDLRDFSILMLIFTSGLTLNEAINLKWHQFFIDASENVGIVFTNKRGRRYIKVHNDIWALLEEYRKRKVRIANQDDYVFLNNRGNRITDRWIRLVLEKACKEADINKTYTPRDLRHTLAAYALKKGASSKQVKNQLGWSADTLAERYLYAIQQLEDNAIDYLNFSLKKENS